MKTVDVLCIVVLFFLANTSSAQEVNDKTVFIDCKINFKPSLKTMDLELFAKEFTQECVDTFEVDKAINLNRVDLRRPTLNPEAYTFRPTIQNLFDSPTFQLGNYDSFQGRFKFSNPAYYEANKNSVLSSGYQDFICPTGGANF